jgi:hypothetical protein
MDTDAGHIAGTGDTGLADRTNRRRRRTRAAALLAGGLVVGGVVAGTMGASASTVTAATRSATDAVAKRLPGGSSPVRSDEKAVTDAQAVTLKAAALKAVPGGTVYRIETDAGDGAYEAHMTKADGTRVTVKFTKNLAVIKVEDGMGTGDPAPQGGQGRPRGESGTQPSSSA